MPAIPWTSAQQPVPDANHVVMASRLPLRHYRHIPRFLRATLAIRRQLRTAPGLVGYALDAQLLRKTFWTLSVWTDDDSLQAFVRAEPHHTVMATIRPLMERPAFAFRRLSGREVPPDWAFARDVLRLREIDVDQRDHEPRADEGAAVGIAGTTGEGGVDP